MTDANDQNPTTMPPLPPPDLTETYAGLPWQWKQGALQLAERILAAAYRADVAQAAGAIVTDLQAGAVKGMTLGEYVEELVSDGHERTADQRKALLCLAYSPNAPLWTDAVWAKGPEDVAREVFAADVRDELTRRGYPADEAWVPASDEHTPGNR